MIRVRKRKLILPVIALGIGGVLYAASGPVPLPHQSGPTSITAKLDATNTPASNGKSMSFGPCKATAGKKTMLINPSPNPPPPGNYSATYKDGHLTCYVWVVNGNATGDASTFAPGTGPTLITLSHPVTNPNDTVTLFVVNSATGGQWDQHSWGPGAANGDGSVTFSDQCKASAGAEQLLFNPSPFQATVSIQYIDETQPGCWVWLINGTVDKVHCNPPSGHTASPQPIATTLTYSCTLPPGVQTITLDITDSDHGGNFDQYTWAITPCNYPPGQSKLTASSNAKGEVSGTLTHDGCSVGANHIIVEKLSDGTTKTVKTNASGAYKFGGTSKYPVTISFNGDATVASAPPVTCTTKGQGPC